MLPLPECKKEQKNQDTKAKILISLYRPIEDWRAKSLAISIWLRQILVARL